MLHTQPQGHWPFGSGEEDFLRVFTIYGHDPEPANKLSFSIPLRPHTKFGFDRPSGFEEDLWKWWTMDRRTDDDRPWLYGPRQANLVLITYRAAKVQARLRIRAVSPEPPLLAHTSSESRGTFRQKVRSLASLNGWACAVKICHDGMLEDTNSLDGAHISSAMSLKAQVS